MPHTACSRSLRRRPCPAAGGSPAPRCEQGKRQRVLLSLWTGHRSAGWPQAPPRAPKTRNPCLPPTARKTRHTSSRGLVLWIALPQLERELPEDFVRIWAVQDDGKTLVRPTACQVRGEAAQGAPDGWFAVELGYFILGNPREGKLTVDIKARGFADATREVVIPSREQRAGASREDFPRRPTGPDILIKMGKVLQRFLTVTTTPGPPEPRPLSITWSGDGLRSTQAAQLPAGRGGGTAKLELDVPASALRVSIDAGPDLLPVSAEIGPEQLVKHVDLRPYGSFSQRQVVLPDGRRRRQRLGSGPREWLRRRDHVQAGQQLRHPSAGGR